MSKAVAYLKGHGLRFQGEATTIQDGPTAGLTWVYFLSPWGMQLELVSYEDGLAYENEAATIMWSPKKQD